MKSRPLIGIGLGLAFLVGCGPIQNEVTETDTEGNAIAWWIKAEVSNGFPAGNVSIVQTNSNGTRLNVVDTSINLGDGPNYKGTRASIQVRLQNHSHCVSPCGYLHAWICPAQKTDCAPDQSIKDMGILPVEDWCVRF